MIPQRVYLRGFLSYRDEQEVRFDGSSMWMLSGLNGSGKSSVFDAVTYSLFGHHRGGHQGAHELVNKDSTGAVVEFDFTQDDVLYRARRTLQRDARGGARGTQQVLRWAPGEGERDGGKWSPVEDTNRKAEFDAWVREHVGLTYETFTSSVLLLQGRAEKLLDSTAKGRFEVLASIVDLERYQRLYEKADGRRKTLKNRVEVLENQLEALPAVAELELVAAENRIADTEEARRSARTDVERWQGLEFQAKRWGEIQGKLADLRRRWHQAEALVAQAEAIEKDMARLRELREVLPHVEGAFKQRRQAQDAETRAAALERERQNLDDKIDEKTQAHEQAKQKRRSLLSKMTADEARLPQLEADLRKLDRVLVQARECDRLRDGLARQEEELSRLPGDTLPAQEQAQRRCDELTALDRAVPLLERLHLQRDGLRQALLAEAARAKEEQEVKAGGERMKAERAAVFKKAEAATKAREKTDREAAQAQALLGQLNENWQAFTELEGARTCRQCGQPLTPGHFEEEKAKREQEIGQARARCSETANAQRAAVKEEKTLLDKLKELDEALEEARDRYREARAGVAQARKDAERFADECGRAYLDLQEPFRARVAATVPDDWLATTYPARADLDQGRREAKGLDAARRQLREAQDKHRQWCELQAQVASTRKSVAAVAAELPPDLPAVRQRHAGLQADHETLAGALRAARDQDRAAQTETDRLQKEREALQKQRGEREAKLNAEEATRKHCLAAVATALKALSEEWQATAEQVGLAELHSLQHEREELEGRGTEARARELEGVRHGVASLKQQLAGTEAEGEGVSPEARREVREVQSLLRDARKEHEARDEAFRKAQQEHVGLLGQKRQREALQQQVLEVDREFKVLTQLAQLLGRDRLQLYLVRQAERQIVDHANSVLDRLSGGQLYLRLCGSDDGEGAEQALELEAYNRVTGQQPINVAFLSGSQRFRVAVSLALGIGQYASRQHRPIESVIIDEGFGCLDRQGRQVMIQELQNLRGQLHCILLVSHQEEFADAFNDGYHFELENGSTRVRRVQR